ncbi:hypothetical protein FHX81_6998 [Saccharothrix saharensis]|uniref:Ig-like domain-containing protein n=1 Tax=Saccharothrix saharensis TaxID=571190 RepID=A0A543JNY6_9PSEU|nr:hypothetical protein [Saccharothrix saharensis]TQM84543.1 hypothetical protein FHX81_6998 [Saccharothrix saharensis]
MSRTVQRVAVVVFAVLALAGMGVAGAQASVALVEREVTTLPVPPLQPAEGKIQTSSINCIWTYTPGRNSSIWVNCYQIGGGASGYSVSVSCSDGSVHDSPVVRFGGFGSATAYCPGATRMVSFTVWAHY